MKLWGDTVHSPALHYGKQKGTGDENVQGFTGIACSGAKIALFMAAGSARRQHRDCRTDRARAG